MDRLEAYPTGGFLGDFTYNHEIVLCYITGINWDQIKFTKNHCGEIKTMSWMYGLSLLASSGINAWQAGKNRKSSEYISALNRDSSQDIAQLSRKHSTELQYNQLKFSVLQQRENQEFQRELAELSHQRLKEIEAFRAEVNFAINQKNLDFQKWSFEQRKKIELEILQLQQDFQRDLARLQHQNAVELMRERLRSDKSPIHNQAFDLLENSFAHRVMPLQVLISPPQLNYDPKTGKPYLSGFENTLAEEIHQFLRQGYAVNQEWPVQFLDGNWISNSQGGNAALLSLHSQLKSIPVLIISRVNSPPLGAHEKSKKELQYPAACGGAVYS